MGVALAGAVVMVSDSYSRGAIAGDLLAIVMAASFATATVLVRRPPEIQMAPAAALATALTALALPFADPLETGPRVIESDLLKQLEAQTPLGRIGQPRDSAPVVVFLASGGAGWITGETLLVARGLR